MIPRKDTITINTTTRPRTAITGGLTGTVMIDAAMAMAEKMQGVAIAGMMTDMTTDMIATSKATRFP